MRDYFFCCLGIGFLAAFAASCAEGTTNAGSGGESGEGGGAVSTSSSSSGNMGGAGGAASGSGGSGGASSSGGGSGGMGGVGGSGAGGAGGSGGSGGSASGTGNLILSVLDGGSAIIASHTNLMTNMGFSNPWTDQTNDAIGLAATKLGTGIAVLRVASGELRYGLWTGNNWSPGFAMPLLPIQAGINILGGPSIATGTSKGHLVYQGTDGYFYYAALEAGLWLPKKEPIDGGAGISTGPVPPTSIVLNEEPMAVFIGNDGDLYDQTRSGGVWQNASSHGVAGQASPASPAAIALFSGPELLIVYHEAATSDLAFTVRMNGNWSQPKKAAGAAAAIKPALAPLPGGGAMLAYKGLDGHLYTAILSNGPMPTWSVPVAGIGADNPMIVTTPALSTGAKGAEAEMIYVDAALSIAYSARYAGGVWSAPALSGGADGPAALAVAP